MNIFKALFLLMMIGLTACEEAEIDQYLDRIDEIVNEDEKTPTPELRLLPAESVASDMASTKAMMSASFQVVDKFQPCPEQRAFRIDGILDHITLSDLPKSRWSDYTEETRQNALYFETEHEMYYEMLFFMSFEKNSIGYLMDTYTADGSHTPMQINMIDENSFELEIRTCPGGQSVIYTYEKEVENERE